MRACALSRWLHILPSVMVNIHIIWDGVFEAWGLSTTTPWASWRQQQVAVVNGFLWRQFPRKPFKQNYIAVDWPVSYSRTAAPSPISFLFLINWKSYCTPTYRLHDRLSPRRQCKFNELDERFKCFMPELWNSRILSACNIFQVRTAINIKRRFSVIR